MNRIVDYNVFIGWILIKYLSFLQNSIDLKGYEYVYFSAEDKLLNMSHRGYWYTHFSQLDICLIIFSQKDIYQVFLTRGHMLLSIFSQQDISLYIVIWLNNSSER